MNAKYIVLDMPDGSELAVIVPPHHMHSQYARGKVVGAGFFALQAHNSMVVVSCWGDSESLKIKSRGSIDAVCIAQLLRCNS